MKENIFKIYFEQNPNQLILEEETYLIELLNNHISRWFVPHFLQEVNHYSEDLMKALIDVGIKIVDPSYNSCFVASALRVHQLKVASYLYWGWTQSKNNQQLGEKT